MAKTTTHLWDITRYLESDEDIAAYLDADLEEDDPALLAAALGDVARAKGQLARGEADIEAGVADDLDSVMAEADALPGEA